jgi:hypothetical protein
VTLTVGMAATEAALAGVPAVVSLVVPAVKCAGDRPGAVLAAGDGAEGDPTDLFNHSIVVDSTICIFLPPFLLRSYWKFVCPGELLSS